MKGEENEINVNHLGIFSKRCQTLRGGKEKQENRTTQLFSNREIII